MVLQYANAQKNQEGSNFKKWQKIDENLKNLSGKEEKSKKKQ